MKKLVLITGVAGLIGSHLAEKLLKNGYLIKGMDTVNLNQCMNLVNVKDNPNFQYYKGDIRSKDDLKNFFDEDAKTIYHLASVVGVNRYMEDPLSLIDIGVLGTRSLIEMCVTHNVRMLFASTSEVYGKNPKVPWSEDDDRVVGATNIDRWSYSTSKAICEHMLFGVHHKNNWPMSIVRFFNVYGPRQNPIYVVSKSVHRVLNGIAPELYDDGNQTRCFTYIEDVIDGIILAAESENAVGEVINLGNPVENNMSDVIKEVIKSANSDLSPIKIDTSEKYGKVYEDIPRRIPDVKKAYKLLGWKPSTSMKDGVRKTVEWARENKWYLD